QSNVGRWPLSIEILTQRLGVHAGHPLASFLASHADALVTAGWPAMTLDDFTQLDGAGKISTARARDAAVARVSGRAAPVDPAHKIETESNWLGDNTLSPG